VVHAISLFVVMLGTWLLLSGIFEPFLLALGVISAAIVVAIAWRMDVIDREGQPIHITWRFILYLPWLGWQILLANIDVLRRVLAPGLPIDPVLKCTAASQTSDLGTVIYANSITLTPGTVSITVEGGRIEVHALTGAAMDAVDAGDMDRRARRVEG